MGADTYADASLVLIPSGYSTGVVYGQRPLDSDSQISFTRASNATRVINGGLIEKVRTNLLIQSNGFTTPTWTKNNITVVGGQTGYEGTSSASLISSTTSFAFVRQTIAASGLNTFSVYAKANTFNFLLIEVNSAGGAWFDLSNGSVGTTVAYSASIEAVGDGWYRCSISGSATTTAVSIYPQESNGTYTSNSGSILIQSSQLETGDIATDYIETGASAVSVGPVSNVPRIDYTGGGCGKLLLEPQRTNLVTFSEQFNDASWLKQISGTGVEASVVANAGISPSGYQDADLITLNSGAGTTPSDQAKVTKNINFLTAGVAYTESIWLKGVSGGEQLLLGISNIETLFIQQKSDPIFKVSLDKAPDLKGYYFLIKENYIHIMMNPTIYEDYFKTIKKSGSIQKRLIYSKLISEALFFIFLEVKNEGYEKLSLKQSFKKVEIIFNSISDYGNFEDFYKDNFNNESKFSFNDLSKIIQKMSDYQFDKLILEMGKI
jgi:hypothetical protein